MTVTETNIAYRTADHLRWQQMDFVVGIEIKLSGNHTVEGRDGKGVRLTDIIKEAPTNGSGLSRGRMQLF